MQCYEITEHFSTCHAQRSQTTSQKHGKVSIIAESTVLFKRKKNEQKSNADLKILVTVIEI